MKLSLKISGVIIVSLFVMTIFNTVSCLAVSEFPDKIEFGFTEGDFYGVSITKGWNLDRNVSGNPNIENRNEGESETLLINVDKINYLENGTVMYLKISAPKTLIPNFDTEPQSLYDNWMAGAYGSLYAPKTINGLLTNLQFVYPKNIPLSTIFTVNNVESNPEWFIMFLGDYSTYWLDIGGWFSREISLDATFENTIVNTTSHSLYVSTTLNMSLSFFDGNDPSIIHNFTLVSDFIADISLSEQFAVESSMVNMTIDGVLDKNGENYAEKFNGTRYNEVTQQYFKKAPFNIFDYWYMFIVVFVLGIFATYITTIKVNCNKPLEENWVCKGKKISKVSKEEQILM